MNKTCLFCGWRVTPPREGNLDTISWCMDVCSNDCLLTMAHSDALLRECIASLQRIEIPCMIRSGPRLNGDVDETMKVITVLAKHVHSCDCGIGNRGEPYEDTEAKHLLFRTLVRLEALHKGRYLSTETVKKSKVTVPIDKWISGDPILLKVLDGSCSSGSSGPVDIIHT